MPGTLHHLIFAEEVYRSTSMMFNKTDFLAGNIIPDLATDKQKSHYRKAASVKGFVVPDLDKAKEELFVIDNPIKFGMYCHLYLDYHFIEEFLIPEFIWDTENMQVINPRNNRRWEAKAFFSGAGMHDAYTEINRLLIKEGHISLSTIESIPRVLPNTGLPVFDERRSKQWRDMMEEQFAQEKEYTGEIFDYERICSSVEKITSQFIEEFFT